MFTENDKLAVLARRVSRGDAAAAAELKHELEPRAVYMVRDVMRTRTAYNWIERYALAAINRLPGRGRDLPPDDQEQHARRLARSLCVAFVQRLRPGPARRLTPRERMCDTMLA